MSKTWIVARHEFVSNVRRTGFLFAAFGIPLFTIALIVIVFAIAFESEGNSGRVGSVGYVDAAGVLDAAREKPETFFAYPDEDAARAAMNAGMIGAYFTLPPDYVSSGNVRLVSYAETPEALEGEINRYLLANLGAGVADEAALARIREPVALRIVILDSQRTLEAGAVAGLFLTPFLFVMVMLMATQITGGYLMSGVVEEKANRIMEMLITSVTPFQMLMGKMIGLGGLGLTQLAVWFAVGAAVTRFGREVEFLAGVSLPPDLVVVGVIYFILSYLLFAALMASIGVIIGSEQESRQYAGILALVMVLPLFFIIQFFTDPDGAIPTILTLVPFTASMTVILRMSFGSVPAWQLGASIALLVLTTLVVVWGAARVFRWSLLATGKRPGVREVLRGLRANR